MINMNIIYTIAFLFLPTCWPKSRVENFTQRSVANEFPLLEALGLVVGYNAMRCPEVTEIML